MFYGGLNGDDYDLYDDEDSVCSSIKHPKQVYCKYCNMGPFSWTKVDNVWRLKTLKGKVHCCKLPLAKNPTLTKAKSLLKDVLEGISLSNDDLKIYTEIMNAMNNMSVNEVLSKLRHKND